MKSFSILATGTFFAVSAFSQETIADAYGAATTALDAATSVADLEEFPTVVSDPSLIVDPLLPTTGLSGATTGALTLHEPIPTGASETTIDGVVYIPKTLCSADSTTLVEPTTVDTDGPTGIPTGYPDGTTLIEPTTVGTDGPTGIPTGYPDGTTLIEPTTVGTDGPTGIPTGYPGGTTGLTTGITTGVTTGITTGGTTLIEPTTVGTDGPSGVPTGYTDGTTGITTGITTGATTGITTGATTGVTTGITTGYTDGTTGITTGITTGVTTGIPTGYTDLPGASATAKIELTKYNEKSRKFDIPTDNTLFPLLRHGFKAAFMSVISADDTTVTCEAFSDKKGNMPLGTPVAVGAEDIDVTNPMDHGMGRESWVRAVRCSAAGGYEAPSTTGPNTTLLEPTTVGTDGPTGITTGITTAITTGGSDGTTLIEPVTTGPSSTTLIEPVTTDGVAVPSAYASTLNTQIMTQT